MSGGFLLTGMAHPGVPGMCISSAMMFGTAAMIAPAGLRGWNLGFGLLSFGIVFAVAFAILQQVMS